jgi:hypothetical protein
MVRSIRFATSVFALGLASAGLSAAAPNTSVSLDLSLEVPAQCGISSVSTSAITSGSLLRVSAACNLPEYALEFSGVAGLDIASTSATQNVRGTIPLGSDSIGVRPSLPGFQTVELVLNNQPSDLENLAISLITN